MATKRKSSGKQRFVNNPLVRILGQHRPAQQVLQQAAQNSALPIQVRATTLSPATSATSATTDYILVDPALTLEVVTAEQSAQPMPTSGVGYAAFTPSQRYALCQWLDQPTEPAPPAFQQFYLAHLEVSLLEQKSNVSIDAPPVTAEIEQLQQSAAWQQHLGLARLRLLATWLAQDGRELARWRQEAVPGGVLGVALGMQALLRQPLQPEQLPMLLHHWARELSAPSGALLALRFSSLVTTLGMDPLAYALGQVAEEVHQPQPWRSQHRDLRIALPQPDLRPILEPLLRDLVVMQDEGMNNQRVPVMEAAVEKTFTTKSAAQWQLVLEFGESRSDFFTFALTVAQQQPGYVALLDEDRRMVHRVHFQRNEMRRFWRLWEYVQSWSTTKVYLNGNEVNKWELYARL